MPVTTPALYAEQSGDPEHFAHVLDHLFRPALESLGYRVLLPSVAGSELIHAEIIKNLEQADLVLCDLSSLNPNVFFELGIRTALDRPVVLVKDKSTLEIPFDLNALNVLTYDGSLKPWTLKGEIPRLTAHIKASVGKGSDIGNSMWRYFGLTKRASPAEIENNPLEAKVDFVISELTRLQQGRVSAEQPREDAGSSGLRRVRAQAEAQRERGADRMRAIIAGSGYDAEVTPLVGHQIFIVENEPIPDSLREDIERVALPASISVRYVLPREQK